jgi:translation initiation factor 4E
MLLPFFVLIAAHSVYNNIMKTCDLSISSNYHLFKQGIKPMWEDPANKHGGKWSIQLPRNKTMSDIDNIWLYTVWTSFSV